MLKGHTQRYVAELQQALDQMDVASIEAAIELLMRAWREGRTVFLAGNGGSAATASHMMVDLNKIIVPGQPRFRAIALTDNVPVLTAWSNDEGYEHSFHQLLQNLCRPGDVLIAISCSGNSPNVLEAVRVARAAGVAVLAFTGDVGGKLRALADVSVLAPHPFIGTQEDIHLVLDHLITEALRAWIQRLACSAARALKALILAAGEGTRLRPLTLDRPKPMLPVRGKPVLGHIIEWLGRHGVADIAVNLHYMPGAIEAYLGDGAGHGIRLVYSREEFLLGSAGAARHLAGYLGDGPFVVAYGDVLTDLDLGALLALHNKKVAQDPRTGITMALYRVPDPTQVGIVEIDAAHRITRFIEKPRPEEVFGNLSNSGILIVEPHVLERIPEGVPYDFGRDLLPRLIAEGVPVFGWSLPAHTYLIDMGTPEKYALAEATFGQPHLQRGITHGSNGKHP